MKPILLLLLLTLASLSGSKAQETGRWRSYLSYYNTSQVAEGSQYVFAVASGSLYSYGKDDDGVRYYSKENGLNDNGISSIGYNAAEKTLVIAYLSGNIDLVTESHTIYNIPFLMNTASVQDKTINSIRCHGEYAYLSTNFGVVVLNVKKREIKETYILGYKVYSVSMLGNDIYSATDAGVFKASLSSNLINPENWQPFVVDIPEAAAVDSVKQICVFDNELCILVKNKGVYRRSDNSFQRILNHASVNNIKTENNKLIAIATNEIYIYNTFTDFDRGNIPGVADVSSLKNNLWIASSEGLSGIKRAAKNEYQNFARITNADSPKYNWDSFMKIHKGKLYIAAGGRWADRFFRPASVMSYDMDGLKWRNYANLPANDATGVAIDPNDDNLMFVSSWGEGVFEVRNGETVNHYNHLNSGLETILANSPNYIRVEGLVFDKERNLWMTNSQVASTIVVRKADGTWLKMNYPEISNATFADKILIASNGHKWVNLVRNSVRGIFVFDDKGTLDNAADDESHYYSSLASVNGAIEASEYTCLAEDHNGQIWIGTNRGVVYVAVPSRGVKGTMVCQRLVYTDESGLPYYFLNDERINAIAVDGGNRKWLGTESSGLYLVSEDGMTVLQHFTSSNSPLLSDRIQSLAINDRTGEVFIGTDKGLISYMGDAIKGRADYSDVYAYPNPVRPEYDGNIIITGLMDNSNVKITDSRGNLVFEGRSNGGQISWNVTNRSGRTVAPGVYLVLSSTPEAKESVVTKIAVVR